MQSTFSSLAAPVFIDGFAFARDERQVNLAVPVAQFERLSESLVSNTGTLVAQLDGFRDKEGRSFINVSIEAELLLQCQRCLGDMSFPLKIERRLELVKSEADVPEDDLENEQADVVVSEREMSVLALVEDEVILALPMISSHRDCAIPVDGSANMSEHPFAGLAKFKKH